MRPNAKISLKIKTFASSVWLLIVNLLILQPLCVNDRKIIIKNISKQNERFNAER